MIIQLYLIAYSPNIRARRLQGCESNNQHRASCVTEMREHEILAEDFLLDMIEALHRAFLKIASPTGFPHIQENTRPCSGGCFV